MRRIYLLQKLDCHRLRSKEDLGPVLGSVTSESIAKVFLPTPFNRRTIWMESILWPLQRKLILVRKEYWIGFGRQGHW